jgi:hypothetical protein
MDDLQQRLEVLRQQLADAMTQQEEADKAVADVMATVEAEFAPVFERKRRARQAVEALESMARQTIEQYRERTGEKPDQQGFSVQMRETVLYDEAELLEWALLQYAHQLVTLDAKAVNEFMRECQTSVNPETGEKVWLYYGAPVPAQVVSKPTAVIQRKALLMWLDEQRFNAEKARA